MISQKLLDDIEEAYKGNQQCLPGKVCYQG